MNDDNEKIYNLKTLILYIKNNVAIVISLIILSVIFFTYLYINTPQEYRANIKIYKKAELENNLNASNVNNRTYDFNTEKLFHLFKTNIQDERKIEEIYKKFIKSNNFAESEVPSDIFSYFEYDLRPEYLSVSLKTYNSDLSKKFLTYAIPELNNISKESLINKLNSDSNTQNKIRNRFYEIVKEQNIALLNSSKDELPDIEKDLSNQRTSIIGVLDQHIATAENLGWKEPQIEILSSLSHKEENRIIIEDTMAVTKFLSSTFNSYPAYLFGYDILRSVKQSISNESLNSLDNIIFNEGKKIINLDRENENIYLPELEKSYFRENLVIDFIKKQMNSIDFRLVNFNISLVTVEKSKFSYSLYLIVSILFGLVVSLIYLFVRDVSISNRTD